MSFPSLFDSDAFSEDPDETPAETRPEPVESDDSGPDSSASEPLPPSFGADNPINTTIDDAIDDTLNTAEVSWEDEDTLTEPLPPLTPALSVGAPARQVRVMHFADVHLGVENYGRYNPQTGLNTRLEDFTQSLNEAIDRALASDIDLAVFAGDAYKARDPNQTHQRAFAEAIKRLTAAGVPVVMLVGNHDIPNTRGRAHALEIYGLLGTGGATVVILQRPEVVCVSTRQGDVLVAGMPYLTRSRVLAQEETRNKTVEEVAHLIREKYVDYIADMAKEAAAYPEHIAVLTGHFTIADARVGTQGVLLNPNEPQVSVRDMSLEAFDYVAMGHVHKHQDMNRGEQPPVIYCGSIDRIDFGERNELKGFVLADIEKGRADFRHVSLPTRPFVAIEVDAGQAEDPTKMILETIARHPIAGAVVRLTYKVAPERAALVRVDEIRKALGAAHLVAALSREMPLARELARSEEFSDSITPEKALALYLEMQPRLSARKEELLTAARPLFEELEREEHML
ncbi:MAG: exonuclease SbcCD subunit D [Armatimonadaceae bacterium]